jgi:ubiquinone/menaquinone biosynthesis C-methylase UbiE
MSKNSEFKDYFSTQALEYSKYRPKYPAELFNYISGLCAEHKLAWDAACGNGQASVGLAEHFDKVIATDASKSQLEHAIQNPKVSYQQSTAESSGLESGAFDLVTVATAIHWIDTVKFYPEVIRVLKPGGIIAIWNYGHSVIEPEIDKILEHFNRDIIKGMWPKETKKSWDFESTVDFPFTKFNTPQFYLEINWTYSEFLNYINTWSAVQTYIRDTNINPVSFIKQDLAKKWGNLNEPRKIKWELKMKAGRG